MGWCLLDLTRVRADARLVAPLRALPAYDFASAENRADLCTRLRAKGFGLAESGGGPILTEHPTGKRLCKGSGLGYGYAQLLRKFDARFPNHKHKWLLGKITRPTPSAPHSPWR